MRLSISAASRTGCVRTNNEDMLLVDDCFVRDNRMSSIIEIESDSRYLFALCDGMGGHLSGEVASSEVLHNLHYFFNDIPSLLSPGDFNETICEWLCSMNNIIDAEGHSNEQLRGMGTTLVALAYYNHEFYSMNCGDSRLYRLHDGVFQQLTVDHSLSNLMGSTAHSSIITNCIGGGCKNSYIDLKQCTDEVQPGDTFLLCSDGLTDMITDKDLRAKLLEGYDAEALCLSAEHSGGYDNVSVIVIHVQN